MCQKSETTVDKWRFCRTLSLGIEQSRRIYVQYTAMHDWTTNIQVCVNNNNAPQKVSELGIAILTR